MNNLYKNIAIWVWPELATKENWTEPDYSNDANSIALLPVIRAHNFGVILEDIGRDSWKFTIVYATKNHHLFGRGNTISEAICDAMEQLLKEV